MNRREFVTELGAVLGAATLGISSVPARANPNPADRSATIPRRILGRTRQEVTILGLGSAPVGHSMPGAEVGIPVYRAALEAGINYIDTARGYDDAEGYLGELVPAWRDRIFLVTKAYPGGASPREAARSMETQFERSLRLLKTDHVDLLHIHNAGQQKTDVILGKEGPMDFARKMKAQGKTRFLGVTGHSNPSRFPALLETGEVDVLMVVLNFADRHTYRFEQDVLPLARKHHCGIIAMKVFGGHRGGFAGYRKPGPAKMPAEWLEKSLRYSLGIPGVTSAVIGPYTVAEVMQDVEWVKRYQPLSESERTELLAKGQQFAAEWGARFGSPA